MNLAWVGVLQYSSSVDDILNICEVAFSTGPYNYHDLTHPN